MAVNLASKYEKQFEAAFKPNAYFEGKTNTKYTFEGAKKIFIYSPVTTPLADYTRSGSNRYGTPTEMDTALQGLELSQDKGFTKTLDRGNYTDSMLAISAGNWMTEQIKGVVTPTVEKYGMKVWSKQAGKTIAASAALSKSNVSETLADLDQALTDAFVPTDGRYLYIPASVFKLLKLSPEFVGIDSLGAKAIGKGEVGEYMGARVVVLPSSYFPAGAKALLARKESILLPRKISTFKTHQNPPGIDGWLMEGRVYYDAFVLGAKSAGVAVLCDNGKQQAAPEISVATGKATITSASASKILYTIDGGDPRYDDKAKVYSAAVGVTAGQVVRAVAYGGSSTPFTSDVVEETVTA